MTVKFYSGEHFPRSHENVSFDYLCSIALEYLSDGATIIGNVNFKDVYGTLIGQADAIVLRPSAIIIVDFKNVGGSVGITEGQEWRTAEGHVISGGKGDKNPFEQLNRYKNYLSHELRKADLFSSEALKHISALVMFTQPIIIDSSSLRKKTNYWFCAADQVDSVKFLRTQASTLLELTPTRMERIVAQLGVEPYLFKLTERLVPGSAVKHATQAAYADAMQDVEDARRAEWLAQNGGRMRAEYNQAQTGWSIGDALAGIRRGLEQEHCDATLVEQMIRALERALAGLNPSLSVVLSAYQPRTAVDLARALRNQGVEPNDFH